MSYDTNPYNLPAPPSVTGVAAGNEICQMEGNARFGNGRVWRAWLSSEAPAINAEANISYNGAKIYYLGNNVGNLIATPGVLVSNVLSDSFSRNTSLNVFTGTQGNGTVAVGIHCSNWTSTLGNGVRGRTTSIAPSEWTNQFPVACNSVDHHLYCFERGTT